MPINRKLSIITVGYRNFNEVMATIESIPHRLRSSVQLVFVGRGFSYDEMSIINTFFDITAFNRDTSIYSAMNIGIGLATCDYITFINSGDLFVDCGAFEKIYDIAMNSKLSVFACASLIQCDDTRAILPKTKHLKKLEIRSGHPGFVAPIRDIKYSFDENRGITADGAWMDQYRKNYQVIVVDKPLVNFMFDGVSSVPKLSGLFKDGYRPLYILKVFLKTIIYRVCGKTLYFKLIVYKNHGAIIKQTDNSFC